MSTSSPPDTLTAELAAIRGLVKRRDQIVARAESVAVDALVFNAAQDRLAEKTEPLLAAVEAVLELHQPIPDGPDWCRECGHSYPCWTRRKITAALTGTESTDDGD